MLKASRVETVNELEHCFRQSSLSRFTAETVNRSHADAHWILDGSNGVEAHCSLWWSNTPCLSGQRVGIIGHYAAYDADAAMHMLHLACKELARQGCTLAVGPMDGSTNRRYRLVTERGTEPPFFLEPDNADDWPDHFTSSGFE